MRDMEQYSRISNIEISGVPVSQNENLESLLCDISKAINVELKEESVEAAHRVPSYNKKRAAPIVVKFKSRRDKETWINGFKATRPLTADKINPRMPKEKVFINEHLSPANKQLLSKTKEAARDRGYKFVWTKDGKIFARKDSGDRVLKITGNSAQQWKLINSLTDKTDKQLITCVQDSDGNNVEDPQQLANMFNEYFINAPLSLVPHTGGVDASGCVYQINSLFLYP
ncbi:uncharacterized protein LOC124371800, partial [Homalodisca vitripennis]|uniref:uncharacterized protein LOC124371800 n=1 Tax=Homalodisca vitripennis TaxID=197043 RepID=UPI001EEB0095